MCTAKCPCYDNGKSFDVYNAYDEAIFNKYGRTKEGMYVETEETITKRYVAEYEEKLANVIAENG